MLITLYRVMELYIAGPEHGCVNNVWMDLRAHVSSNDSAYHTSYRTSCVHHQADDPWWISPAQPSDECHADMSQVLEIVSAIILPLHDTPQP